MARKIIVPAATAVLVVSAAIIGASWPNAVATGVAASSSDTCAAYDPNVPLSAQFVGTIDNPYFPLPVGRTLVYRGAKGSEAEIDRVTVTSKTRVIDGITATTVRDVARHRGNLLEKTKDWYAQDDQGNVWYLGEATASFEGGSVDRSGSWMAGVDGAKPGLIMKADPQVPDSYRQECLQGQAEDMAWIVSIGGSETVPYGRVHRVIRSLEYARIEPKVVDQKVYAPGVGIASERTMAGGHEVWRLVSVVG